MPDGDDILISDELMSEMKALGCSKLLGAITGDIVGSVYEFANIKTKDFPLFSDGCKFTDDTVLTVACADALMAGASPQDFADAYKRWALRYQHAGYGSKFALWLGRKDPQPYNSFGNGSAMRVSPCIWFASTLAEAEALAETSAAVTHNHPEGIKGAQATAAAGFMARKGKSKAEIKAYIEDRYGYDLSQTLAEIRPTYMLKGQFRGAIDKESCQQSVPQAIICFLESTDFEDAIRNAVSLGGDSDTLAAIAGGIAQAAYGVPDDIRERAMSYLDAPMLEAIRAFEQAYMANDESQSQNDQ